MFRPTPVIAVIALAVAGAAVAQPGMLAAAEAFKRLGEAAFSAPDSDLKAAVARASAMVAGVRATLPPGAARDMDAELRTLAAASRAGDRASIALASAEAYRILVGLSNPASKIPPEVRLLDYARLRYKGDLLARPPGWDDARDAVAFARERWTTLRPRIGSGSLRLKIDDVLDELDSAAADRDPARGDQAANDLLDLIDQLEAYFAAP